MLKQAFATQLTRRPCSRPRFRAALGSVTPQQSSRMSWSSFRRCSRAFERFGMSLGACEVPLLGGGLLKEVGRIDEAIACLQAFERRAAPLERTVHSWVECSPALGHQCNVKGQFTDATRYYGEALPILREAGLHRRRRRNQVGCRRCVSCSGQNGQSDRCLSRCGWDFVKLEMTGHGLAAPVGRGGVAARGRRPQGGGVGDLGGPPNDLDIEQMEPAAVRSFGAPSRVCSPKDDRPARVDRGTPVPASKELSSSSPPTLRPPIGGRSFCGLARDNM